MARRRERLLARLPAWARTVRTRLAVTYSALLFGIAALLLGGVYGALSRTIDARPLDPVTVQRFEKDAGGRVKYRPGQDFQAADLETVQQAVNFSTLQTLRNYSAIALAVLFVLSLLVGWWVAGRALRPVGRITNAAREIGATDLSRRIAADGPPDELRELADTLDDMLDRLDAAFTDQRNLIDDVSHELRNPVAVIRANIEAVLSRDDVTPTERRHAAQVVARAGERMTRLVDDLLATARMRSGAFEEVELDLSALVADAVEEHRLLAGQRGLVLSLRLAGGSVVFADAVALSRAVGNLLSNAVRFAPDGSVFTVAVGSRDGWAWVAVRDTGPGIAPADQQRIFDRFYRAAPAQPAAAPAQPGNATVGSRHTGPGLGLAIARQVAEGHGGAISVFSEPGDGATFVVWLPDRSPLAPPHRGAVPDADPLGRGRP